MRTSCETLKVCTSGYCDWRNRIARLMRSMHLQGVSRRHAWCVTTERNQRRRPAPDLLKRRFVAKDINELWLADMTYVPTPGKDFLHLSVFTWIENWNNPHRRHSALTLSVSQQF